MLLLLLLNLVFVDPQNKHLLDFSTVQDVFDSGPAANSSTTRLPSAAADVALIVIVMSMILYIFSLAFTDEH